MAFGGYKAQASPAALFWAAGVLLFALLSLGLVDNQSARHARAQLAGVPERPLLVVDLLANRGARGGKPLPELEAWREAGALLGRPVEQFTGEGLQEIDPNRYALWVLPAQNRLSDVDWAALDAYLAGEGGLILTGASGLRAEDGSERGRSVLERLFPGERFETAAPVETSLRVVGRSPLVAGLEPGAELALEKRGRTVAATSPGALEWRGEDAASAVLVGRHRNASIAWLGFSIGQLSDARLAQIVAMNALRFAAREPLLDLRPWPDGRPCAVLVDGAGATDSPDALCRAEANQIEGPQLDRLIRSGCRFATIDAGERTIPELLAHPREGFLAIPEPQPRRDAQGAALMRELLAGYERAERMGSVFSLRTDPGWRAAKGREALLASVGDEISTRGAWFARPAELADWWLAREQVEARLEPLAADTVRVVFANRGAEIARGVTARVYIPGGALAPRVEAGRFFARRALLRLADDHSWIELVARPLDPGTEVSYTLRF